MAAEQQMSTAAVCELLREVIGGATSREDASDAARLVLDGGGVDDAEQAQALAILTVCDTRDHAGGYLLTTSHLRAWLKDLERNLDLAASDTAGRDDEGRASRGGPSWLARADR